jgi:hypothetical protein
MNDPLVIASKFDYDRNRKEAVAADIGTVFV